MYNIINPLNVADQIMQHDESSHDMSVGEYIVANYDDEIDLYNDLNYLDRMYESEDIKQRAFDQGWLMKTHDFVRLCLREHYISFNVGTLDQLEEIESSLEGMDVTTETIRNNVNALSGFDINIAADVQEYFDHFSETLYHFPTDVNVSFWEGQKQRHDGDGSTPFGWYKLNSVTNYWSFQGFKLVESLAEYFSQLSDVHDNPHVDLPVMEWDTEEYTEDNIEDIILDCKSGNRTGM